jgi:phospholipid/cholesterol/gamma-HCH transport system substrate-binding protein
VKVETKVGLFILGAIAVFVYLSLNIRAIRFDKHRYNTYKAYFDDTGGLTVKAPVKIAGVDVGWVEEIDLLDDGKAEINLMVNKNVKLAKNAYATIRQDGLIGTKTLDIESGDPSTGLLLPGSTLSMPGKTPTSVGELLDQFRDIAATIQDITSSLKNVFATHRGEE